MILRRFIFTLLLALCATPAFADCFDDAAAYHGVNPWVLRGIAHVESGFKAHATNVNRNGTMDIGMMQTNSIHLKNLSRFGVSRTDLFDGCKSVYVAAWMLRQKIEKHGNTWVAVGSYHSETPYFRDRYAAKVSGIIARWARRQPLQ